MEATCYGGGDIAGAVFGTLIGGALLAFLVYWLYKKYWKGRKGEFQLQFYFIFSLKWLNRILEF